MDGDRLRKPTCRRVPGLVTLLVIAAAGAGPVHAEFTVGDEVPAFSLKTTDGGTVELRRDDGMLTVRIGDERITPKALIIHLLQPDCLQCRAQLQALKPIADRCRGRGVVTLAIAHRGTLETAREFARQLELPFPVALGVGSEPASRFAAGDTLGITDANGIVRFAQVGYGEGDAEWWQRALDELLAGGKVSKPGIDRERLAVGDRMPAIHLPSLRADKPMSLAGEGDHLVFRDEAGGESRPKAAIGFFSRY